MVGKGRNPADKEKAEARELSKVQSSSNIDLTARKNTI